MWIWWKSPQLPSLLYANSWILANTNTSRPKKRDEAKKNQKQVQIKEIKFRPGTDEGDYQIKMRNINRFLADGDKVKVTLRFRGREMAHQQLGAQLLERVKEDLAEVAQIEQFPKMEGRQMVMMIAPKKK